MFIASYPVDSVGFVQAVTEIGFKPKIIGGGMVGLQSTSVKTQLGTKLNGFIDYDFWLPVETMKFPGVLDMLTRYQAKAEAEGVDPLGYYMAPFAYAYIDLLGQAVTATKGTDDAKIAEYLHSAEHKTFIGPVKFNAGGEWEKDRQLLIQFQGVKGNGLDQFKGTAVQPILSPASAATGKYMEFNKAR